MVKEKNRKNFYIAITLLLKTAKQLLQDDSFTLLLMSVRAYMDSLRREDADVI